MGCNVIHFPYHDFVFCAIPSVYNPHDLQHRHFPEFFERSVLAWRESTYPMACRLAQVVAVTSQWVKQDVEQQYSVNANKIQVIPWAPPTEIYASPTAEDLESARRKFDLAQAFALYPAMIYKHKNHVRLLEAVASLRDREGLRVDLVCTGAKQPFWSEIEKHLERLGLQNQVKFPGMVSPEELRCFYRLAKFVIVPTLFEAASGPLFEAWQDGVPAACSTVTSLPEQAGDAALLFDPYSVESIAQAIRRMATEPALLDQLRGNGARRLQDFSWERTARAYRALYRRLAHSALTDEDRRLLEWDWMKDPRG